jgi:hypothetical protein
MDHIDVLLCFVCVLFAVICPFTKVEESFNIDAIHDFLFLPWMSLDYEHHTFPGVVPRTSLGAFLVALLVESHPRPCCYGSYGGCMHRPLPFIDTTFMGKNLQ